MTGRVLDGLGRPLAARTVLVSGVSTTTDANGTFRASGVATPYDVILLELPAKRATVYARLTRTDPQLVGSTENFQYGTFGGQLVGGDPFPTPEGTLTAVVFSSPEGGGGSGVFSNPYVSQAVWYGPTSSTGNVHALQWTVDANGTVTGYRSHGVRTAVTLTANTPTSGVDITLTPTLAGTVSGTITIPSGYSLSSREVLLSFADGTYFFIGSDTVESSSFSLPVPSGIGASAIIRATASSGAVSTRAQVSGLAPGSTHVVIAPPPAALIISPPDGATGVDTATDFTWTPVANAIYRLGLWGSTTYFIVTDRTSVRIPDLTAYGFGLPSAGAYDWALGALGPYASVDEFTAPGEVPFEESGFSTGASASFTTR